MKPVAINFKKLVRPDKPNWYLACPKGYCNIKPDMLSSCFDVGVDELKEAWLKILEKQPRITELSQQNRRYQYIQRSLVFRFPDYVTVEFIPISKQQSTLALLSFAKYGYYDFGVNKDRVKRLLNDLKKKLSICH